MCATDQRLAGGTPDTGNVDVACVLLLLQGGFGLLSTLGLLFFIAAAPALAPLGLFAAAMTVLPIVLALGVARLWRWAQVGATVFEGLVLLAASLRLLLYRGSPPGIVWLLGEVVLPIAVAALIWSGGVRAAIDRPVAPAAANPHPPSPSPAAAGEGGTNAVVGGRRLAS